MKTRILVSLFCSPASPTARFTRRRPAPPSRAQPAPPPQDTAAAPPSSRPPARSARKSRCSIPRRKPSPSVASPFRWATTACSRPASRNTSASRPESDEAATRYRETIAEILATISPFRSRRTGSLLRLQAAAHRLLLSRRCQSLRLARRVDLHGHARQAGRQRPEKTQRDDGDGEKGHHHRGRLESPP